MTETLDSSSPFCLLFVFWAVNLTTKLTPSSHFLGRFGCLSVMRLKLLNWEERNPACFSKESRHEENPDLLNMERGASFLGDVDRRLSGQWNIFSEISELRAESSFCVFMFLHEFGITKFHVCAYCL